MKDGHDDDFLFVFLIENRVGKTFNEGLSNITVNFAEESWVGGDPFDDLANFADEIPSQSPSPRFVPFRRLIELRFRLRQKPHALLHGFSLDKASASTCSQAIAASGLAR